MAFQKYNLNPAGKSVGDCTIRAVSKALGQSWEETYVGLALEGFLRGDLPNSDDVWGHYLKARGFSRHWIPDDCPDCYTVARFAEDHPGGTFILSMPGRHGAKAYMVAPGNSVLLMDSENSAFYIKSTDASGMPMPLRAFDYAERTAAPKTPQNAPQALAAEKPAKTAKKTVKEETDNG